MPDQPPQHSPKPALRLGAGGTVIVIIIAVVMAIRQGGKPAQGPVTSPASHTPPAATGKGPETASGRTPSPRAETAAEPERAKPTAKPASANTASIRIGTWNIEWLGKPEKRSGLGTGTAQTPDDLADYIAASGVSVLALEEIIATGPSASGKPLSSKELDAAFAAVERRQAGAWRYVLFPGRDSGDQLTGVAWNADILSAKDDSAGGWRVPVKGGRGPQGSGLWNRPPHALQFSTGAGKTDFTLVVVHMKADYEGEFAEHRAMEARALAAALPETRSRFGDQDVVVLGDTNMTAPAEPARTAFESAGLIDLNSKSETTHWRGGTMDRIFVPSDQPEFSGGATGGTRKFEVMSDRYLDPKRWDPRDFKRRLSDHYMVVTTVTVMPDDD